MPDALSRLTALGDPVEREDGDAILDSIWFVFAEARIEDSLRQRFINGYAKDPKYAAIINDLTVGNREEAAEDSGTFSRRELPFVLIDSLLYNIRPDGLRALCVPRRLIAYILELTHDEKHHFGQERMLYDLRGVSFSKKTRLVEKYV